MPFVKKGDVVLFVENSEESSVLTGQFGGPRSTSTKGPSADCSILALGGWALSIDLFGEERRISEAGRD